MCYCRFAFRVLENKYNHIISSDREVFNSISEGTGSEVELAADCETANEYFKMFNVVEKMLTIMIVGAPENVLSMSSAPTPVRMFKLSRIELKFWGNWMRIP
ncbi:hypothetical protein JTB14_037233 [Gonioctena quinquepunctata]|nr:hypothetical protein JTB14_037233 [Gonioctena quinquepunctata]